MESADAPARTAGNGRIHRYLIHHSLAARGFSPPGATFPVSSAILMRIDEHRHALECYSMRLLPLIEWRATEDGNVIVLNDTADLYRYFDVTLQAEFLLGCVVRTIEEDLPREAGYLRRYDAFRDGVGSVVEMPDRTIDLLFRMLRQNEGRVSARARQKEFPARAHDEVARIEAAYAAAFGDA